MEIMQSQLTIKQQMIICGTCLVCKNMSPYDDTLEAGGSLVTHDSCYRDYNKKLGIFINCILAEHEPLIISQMVGETSYFLHLLS